MKINTRTILIVSIFIVAVIGISLSTKKEKANTENIVSVKKEPILKYNGRDYTTPWSDALNDSFMSVTTLLNQNQISGCGELYYNEIERNTFIVACTRDGENFTHYILWPKQNKLYKVESDMLTIYKEPK